MFGRTALALLVGASLTACANLDERGNAAMGGAIGRCNRRRRRCCHWCSNRPEKHPVWRKKRRRCRRAGPSSGCALGSDSSAWAHAAAGPRVVPGSAARPPAAARKLWRASPSRSARGRIGKRLISANAQEGSLQ